MGFSNTFAGNTAPQNVQLDQNFQQAGLLGTIPCTVAGSNTITLTPVTALSPTIAAYNNYLRFSGVAAADNTSTVTVQVGALAALTVYKDSPAGPVVLTGGELKQHCAFVLVYDSALSSGNGGFHLFSMVLPSAGYTLTGPLRIAAPGTVGTIGFQVSGSVGGTIGFNAYVMPSSVSAASLIGGSLVSAPTLSGASLATAPRGSFASLHAASQLLVGAAATLGSLTQITRAYSVVGFTLIPAHSSQIADMTVPNIQVGDPVMLGFSVVPDTGLLFNAYCGTAGTVSVRAGNITAASITAFSVSITAVGMRVL